jgi:hypothetical protein
LNRRGGALRIREKEMMSSAINVVDELSVSDRTLIRSLIEDGQTIVHVSSMGSEWAEAALAQRQNIRALLYASPEAERDARGRLGLNQAEELGPESSKTSGLNLDEDTAAEGIPHIHFLNIGGMQMARHVLRGANHLLAEGRIDFVQLSVDTHDFLTGRALIEMLAERRYGIFEIEVIERNEIRLTPYLIFNPNRGRSVASVLGIKERLIRQTSLLLLQSMLHDPALHPPSLIPAGK